MQTKNGRMEIIVNNILPVIYPPITSYPGIAQPLSILFTEKEKILPWFMTRYLQLTALHPDNHIPEGMNLGSFLDSFLPIECEGWEEYSLPRDFIDTQWENFTDFLKYCLSLNYYIQLSVNMYYFPCSPAYHKANFMHFPLIYGHDKDSDQFLVADFYAQTKYSFEKVSSKEIEMAYKTATFEELKYGKIYDYVYIVKLYKYASPTQYTFDFSEFLIKLHDYVNGIDSTHCQERDKKFKSYKYVHGIIYYDAMADYLRNRRCDMKVLHVLCDHKQAHLLRLDYLLNNRYLSSMQYQKLKDMCQKLYRDSLIVRNKYIKEVGMKKYNDSEIEISNILLKIKENDQLFCNQLIYDLKK